MELSKPSEHAGIQRVVCKAPVNIAVVKYWGKKDEDLIVPLNDSISVTLSTEHLRARTDISLDFGSSTVEFYLNGKQEQLSKRFSTAVRLSLEPYKTDIAQGIYGLFSFPRCTGREEAACRRTAPSETIEAGLRIVSDNNFPTAAGLASSAAGFACLVSALKVLYNIDSDISRITRQGCGSACRSVFGGFVRWYAGGGNSDGSDSFAKELYPASHWPDLRILILVVNDQKKETASTSGMKDSVETSELLRYRALEIVPERCDEMEEAIKSKDFPKFAELTMRDSNQLHAICLDTFPPIAYLNDVSHSIIQLVHKYNKHVGKCVAAYTFDAGPNAFLFTTEDQLDGLVRVILRKFPSSKPDFLRGIPISAEREEESSSESWLGYPLPDAVHYVILTKPGEGPKVQRM